MRVLILNGPNLNLLGSREPGVYGTDDHAALVEKVTRWGSDLSLDTEVLQSNREADLIEAVQRSSHDGIVLNPGALTHTSRALGDAIASVEVPVVETHISNVLEREPWRATSVISEACVRTIYGRGTTGYRDALRHLANRLSVPIETVRYGPHDENVGDLRTGDQGLVVLVHGGFWRHEWARDTMESLAVDLTRRGLSTWNIEYRRLGRDGGWPGSFHDTLMALDFIPQLGSVPGGVSVIGHSAGASLALWAAGRSRTDLRQVVSMAGVLDLESHARSDLYGAAEAQTLLDSGAPPRSVTAEVPTLLVHGTDDRHVPHAYSEAQSTSNGVELISPATDHFQLLDPARPAWDDVADSVVATVAG